MTPSGLRRDAERVAGALPPLLAEAERLAATVVLGAHGRRRPGIGETFWQYRRATPGDPLPLVDWRRSARSDALYVRETEWEAAQTVWLWADAAASMQYRSGDGPRAHWPTKSSRAALLIAALAVLLSRGGERIAALDTDAMRPSSGETQLGRVVGALANRAADASAPDYATPPRFEATRGGGSVIFVSDFFGDETEIVGAIRAASGQGLAGLLLQVVDPAEEDFGFDGRVLFESMSGGLRYETDRAAALKRDYQNALEARRARILDAARSAGWRFSVHRTDTPAAPALMWLAQGLSKDFHAPGG